MALNFDRQKYDGQHILINAIWPPLESHIFLLKCRKDYKNVHNLDKMRQSLLWTHILGQISLSDNHHWYAPQPAITVHGTIASPMIGQNKLNDDAISMN
jgi:hypothetical protein